MPEIHTILYPTDFSESSEVAGRLACALARDHEARLIVLTAYTPRPARAAAADEVEGGLVDRLQDLVPDDRTIAVEYRAVAGRPAEVIQRVAAETGCDLIVMGTLGRTGLRRAALGSVAEEVSRRAPCPVATIRPSVTVPRETTPPAADDLNLDIGIVD